MKGRVGCEEKNGWQFHLFIVVELLVVVVNAISVPCRRRASTDDSIMSSISLIVIGLFPTTRSAIRVWTFSGSFASNCGHKRRLLEIASLIECL